MTSQVPAMERASVGIQTFFGQDLRGEAIRGDYGFKAKVTVRHDDAAAVKSSRVCNELLGSLALRSPNAHVTIPTPHQNWDCPAQQYSCILRAW